MIMDRKPQEGDEVEAASADMKGSDKMPPRMMSVDDSVMLPENYEPSDDDVICSWARQNHGHRKYGMPYLAVCPCPVCRREYGVCFVLMEWRCVHIVSPLTLIEKYAPVYLHASTKYQKSEVIAKIVTEVRNKSPTGGFVKKDFYSGRWFEIGDEKARDKVGHAIRKAAGELGKKRPGGAMSSKKASQSAAQKRKLSSEQPVNLDAATLGLMGSGGLNAGFLNNQSSLLGLNPSALALGGVGLGLGLGDNRTDRATASFLQPTLDNSFSASPDDNNAFLLQSLQRQRLLMNAAQQQNLGLLQQAATMGLSGLSNPLLNMQSLPLDLASLPQGALFSPGLNSQLSNLSQQQQQQLAALMNANAASKEKKEDES
ncbi:MAG: hypothetical protein SGILL_003902 [Bacillariaceae sp.]